MIRKFAPESTTAKFLTLALIAVFSSVFAGCGSQSAHTSSTSTPPPAAMMTVPNVVGVMQAAATTAITGAGLVAGTITTAPSATVASGQVISESPAAGASVAAGSAVNLVVSSGTASAQVPNVVGSTQAAATTALTGAGLVAGTITTAPSATVASGQVISESPVAGTSVAAGSAVNLVVSSGTASAQVPNVVGSTQAAATTALTGAGLVAGMTTTAPSATVASGQVISENPAAGTSVTPGSAVNLVVSSGAASAQVPNVVGDTQATATTAITGAGLLAGTITSASSTTVPSGEVISENPAAGASVGPGSAVNLVLSTGPDTCTVSSITKLSTTYENLALSPNATSNFISQQDSNSVYQIYSMPASGSSTNLNCITCTQVTGGPPVSSNKFMPSIHPSGNWLVVGVEETTHDLQWLPASIQDGFLESGVWLNIWITNPTGTQWFQVTNFNPTQSAPANGFVGVAFSSDGNSAVWAEIVGNVATATQFGVWRLFKANFVVSPDGTTPSFTNQTDITPAGAQWVEPGNFAPNSSVMLISTDIGLGAPGYAYGQDQWSIDIASGALVQLTNTPTVWDEHGLYSPNGKKIIWMSSLPYEQSDPNSYMITDLKTEFMIMNADGTNVQQLTHFNTPGYPESQSGGNTIAAVAEYEPDGSLFATVLAPNQTKTNWSIHLSGTCGTN